jgi:hypothetical protein
MANYHTVKNGIAGILGTLGYSESAQSVDFKHASANEYGNRYILKCLSGENLNDTIIDRFHDSQEWQILIAFSKSEQNDIVKYDEAQRAKDAIIKYIDNPTNWVSFVKMLKYSKWELVEAENYFILDVRLEILDIYTHT